MDKPLLFQFLNGCGLGVLSSLGPDGGPQSALVGIAVTPELEIVFDTVQESRKFANIARDPRVAFVIGWQGEITVQYEGVARQISSTDLGPYHELIFGNLPTGRPDSSGKALHTMRSLRSGFGTATTTSRRPKLLNSSSKSFDYHAISHGSRSHERILRPSRRRSHAGSTRRRAGEFALALVKRIEHIRPEEHCGCYVEKIERPCSKFRAVPAGKNQRFFQRFCAKDAFSLMCKKNWWMARASARVHSFRNTPTRWRW